jgi:CHAD domain-containing protein
MRREDKFDVDAGYVLPDIAGLLPDGGRVERSTELLRSDYFDTADRALLRAGITLRRRTGTTDTGWQLKVAHAPAQEEIRVPLEGDVVPEEFRRLLLGVCRGQLLNQVANVVTERSAQRLLDADGRRLAEIDDDSVRSSAAGDTATLSSWREVEIELGDGDEDLLRALATLLRRAGAHRSPSRSKLSRALTAIDTGTRRHKPRAADVVADYVAEQQQMMLAGDLALRRGQDDVIHKTRVATRRLRSTLRSFNPLVEPTWAAGLDAELRWYAGLLGQVRDRQVLWQRLDRMVDNLPDTQVLGPVRARIDGELGREQAEHWQSLQDELCGPRYLALLTQIDQWVTDPRWTPAANKPTSILPKLVRRAERKVSRRLDRANKTGEVSELHGARKAAKRARYAAELAAPLISNKPARKNVKRYQELQDLLGEHQDSHVSADLLRRLAAKAGTTPGENGFTFGVLYEQEHQNARTSRDEARRIAAKYR